MNIYVLWALLIALSAVANIPCLLYFLKQRNHPMPVLSQFQAPIDELNASAASIAAVVADLKAQVASAPQSQDINDTLAAVQAGADAVKAAVGQ